MRVRERQPPTTHFIVFKQVALVLDAVANLTFVQSSQQSTDTNKATHRLTAEADEMYLSDKTYGTLVSMKRACTEKFVSIRLSER